MPKEKNSQEEMLLHSGPPQALTDPHLGKRMESWAGSFTSITERWCVGVFKSSIGDSQCKREVATPRFSKRVSKLMGRRENFPQ